jgi:hypothetical protein
VRHSSFGRQQSLPHWVFGDLHTKTHACSPASMLPQRVSFGQQALSHGGPEPLLDHLQQMSSGEQQSR